MKKLLLTSFGLLLSTTVLATTNVYADTSSDLQAKTTELSTTANEITTLQKQIESQNAKITERKEQMIEQLKQIQTTKSSSVVDIVLSSDSLSDVISNYSNYQKLLNANAENVRALNKLVDENNESLAELQTEQESLQKEVDALQQQIAQEEEQAKAEQAAKALEQAVQSTATTTTTSSTSSTTTSVSVDTSSATYSSAYSAAISGGASETVAKAFATVATEHNLTNDELVGWTYIINHESTWNPSATNASSGAYGLGQALPASKMASFGSDYLTNPVTQLEWMYSYMAERYGSVAGAYGFWLANSWY